MKALAGFTAVALFFALGAVAHAQNNQGNNQGNNNQGNNNQGNNNNNNVVPLAPRISRPARIRDPMLRLTPQQFITRGDTVTNFPLATSPSTNGPDGRVTRAEFLAALRVRNRNISVTQSNALFDTLDADLNGFITLADFNQFFLLPGGGGT